MEKRKPLKIHAGANPVAIMTAVESGEGIMTEYVPPESVFKSKRILNN